MRSRKNNMTRLDADRLAALWNDPDLSNEDVREAFGCSFTKVRSAAAKLGLPMNRKGTNNGRRRDDPTPEEIAQRAAEIRAGWTIEQMHDRAGIAPRFIEGVDL